MVKRVNINVFGVLKSIVDSKVPAQQKLVHAGDVARMKLPDLRAELDNLYKWEKREGRYGRPAYDRGDKTPDDYETEIKELNDVIDAGDVATGELKAADKFYKTYDYVLRVPEIEHLQQELYETEAWQEHWRSKMCADSSYQDDEQLSEASHYEMEYNGATKRVNVLKARLAEIQNTR